MSPGEQTLLRLVNRGYFQIRDDGTIWRAMLRTRTGALVPVDPVRADFPHRNGYRSIKAQVGGVTYFTQAHRLIWIAANGPIPSGIEVNHEDGDRANNRLSNLSLLDHGGNQRHAYENLGRTRCHGSRNGAAKLSPLQVGAIRQLKGVRSSRDVGAEFGISHRQVLNIWNGKKWCGHG